MKKTYDTPKVWIERFTLSDCIAGCSYGLMINSGSDCSQNETVNPQINRWVMLGHFAEGICREGEPEPFDGMGICYHTSMPDGTVFSS